MKGTGYLLLTLLMLLPVGVAAQQELEYRMEVGGALGTAFYLGDANKTPFRNSSAMAGFLLRRNLNPRMVIKTDLAYGNLRGKNRGFLPTDAYTPGADGGTPATVKFSRSVLDLGAQFEFNFWGYGTGASYKGYSRITPYVLAGVGFTLAMGGGANANASLNFPVGLGVKYKVKPRVNVGAEWTFRFTTSDKLDATGSGTQLVHPLGINAVGLKNKDCYSFLMLYLTYDISPIYRKCNN